jgi:hypothetical protein
MSKPETTHAERIERDLLEYTVQRLIDAAGAAFPDKRIAQNDPRLLDRFSNILRGKLK